MTAYTPWRIAHVCHEANRALQIVNCDLSPSPPWAQESEEVHRFAVAAVEFAMRGGTPEEQFRNWRDAKAADGWTYGPVKDPAAKTHPCMVADYADLPETQRVKDAVFAAIVREMSGGEDPREELAAVRERLRNLAADLKRSAAATAPSKKSAIERECAEAVRGITEGK